MPLPTLNWKRLAPVTLAAANVNAALDAIYAAGTATTYADGSPRVQGTGSAWSWTGNIDTTNALQVGATTAVWAAPPTTTALAQRVIWAGSTNAPTAMPLYSTDTRTPGMLYCSVVKNGGGAYSNWNSATVFTGGDCLGFATGLLAFATAGWTTLTMWECEEAVAVQWSRVAPNIQTSINICGAFLDPGATANGESDGRIYGLTTSASNNYQSTTMWSATGNSIFYETGSANAARFGAFTPGLTTLQQYVRIGSYVPATTFLARDNAIPLVPVWVGLASSLTQPARLREIMITVDTTSNRTLDSGGTAIGYTLGANYITTAADTAVLLA